MKMYCNFKRCLLAILFFSVLGCLYCWIINDFNSGMYDFFSKAVVVCFVLRLGCFVFDRVSQRKINKN